MENKKRLAIINAVPYGSTGKIVRGISKVAEDNGWETLIYYSWTKNLRSSDNEGVMVGSFLGKIVHMALGRLTGKNGCYSKGDTKKLLKRLDEFKPDVINLHILHSWNINLPMLFSYVKEKNIRVIWTMHDCWAITGQCPHFIMAGCDKWKTGCYSCPQYRNYPSAYVDATEKMWKLKKEWFTGVPDMTVATPSSWLAGIIGESYLKDYPVRVINNGIDLSIFKPVESDFREKYGLSDKRILLGVAFDWGKRKGLDVFIELSKRLGEEYKIVLVGTNEEIDTLLPENILSIHKTANQAELAEIYSSADLFLNPTREDTFPTVNMEALACGAPVITFKTGGSPEILSEKTGAVVECDDIDAFEVTVRDSLDNGRFAREDCVSHARRYDQNERFLEYIELIREKSEQS